MMPQIPIKHLEAAARRWSLQSCWSMRFHNWSMCLCGPLCVLISGTDNSWHQMQSVFFTNKEEEDLLFNIRRIPR